MRGPLGPLKICSWMAVLCHLGMAVAAGPIRNETAPVPSCAQKLLKRDEALVHLVEKGVQRQIFSVAQVEQFAADGPRDVLRDRALPAEDGAFRRAYSALLRSYSGEFPTAVKSGLERLAARLRTQADARAEAERETAPVQMEIPRTLLTLPPDTGSVHEKFFWYRDEQDRPFLAIADGKSHVLRTVEVKSGRLENFLRRVPDSEKGDEATWLKPRFVLFRHELKYLYGRRKAKELVLYDVKSEKRSPANLTFEPNDMQVASNGDVTFAIVSNEKHAAVYKITDTLEFINEVDLINPLTLKSLEITESTCLVDGAGELMIVARELGRGQKAYLFKPLISGVAQHIWDFGWQILTVKAFLSSKGDLFLGAELTREGERPHLALTSRESPRISTLALTPNFRYIKSVEISWKETSAGVFVVAEDANTLLVTRQDQTDPTRGAQSLPGRIAGSTRWMASADGRPYFGTYAHGTYSIFEVTASGEVQRVGSVPRMTYGSQGFRALDGTWFALSTASGEIRLHNLRTGEFRIQGLTDPLATSLVYEYQPGSVAVASMSVDGAITVTALIERKIIEQRSN